ncbi:hypothetical protein EVAR_56195_1 [Eumeta japonica]|uniref:Shavenoid isoform B-like N-terminal domain-containing protein n=1 Tax=Eumeta variegata TaxID=151549 RepID=A0A4C1Y5S3_EUMVA|nr:hypothetical protein EVAR_56195_1 [Eumeta japonica]
MSVTAATMCSALQRAAAAAGSMRCAAPLLLALLALAGAAARLGDFTRRENGDTFTLLGGACGPAHCAEHGARAGEAARDGEGPICSCYCPTRAPLFREDRELCVDDLPGEKNSIVCNGDIVSNRWLRIVFRWAHELTKNTGYRSLHIGQGSRGSLGEGLRPAVDVQSANGRITSQR